MVDVGWRSWEADEGYLGKQWDRVAGAYWYGFRAYEPGYGRFTTVDPIKSGTNWYAYCLGDPVNLVDLWGLEDEGVVIIVNVPGFTDEKYEEALVMAEENPKEAEAEVEEMYGVEITRPFTVVSPSNAEEFVTEIAKNID